MDPDFFIENNKYLDKVGIILPLPSGEIALLNNQRKLVGKFRSWESLVLALQDIESTIRPHSAPVIRKISLEDLGLL